MIKQGRSTKGEYQIRTFRIKQDSFDLLADMSKKTGLSKTYILEQAIKSYVNDWKDHKDMIHIVS